MGIGPKHDSPHSSVGSGDSKAKDDVTNEVDQSAEISDPVSLDAGGTIDQESEVYGWLASCINKYQETESIMKQVWTL